MSVYADEDVRATTTSDEDVRATTTSDEDVRAAFHGRDIRSVIFLLAVKAGGGHSGIRLIIL